VVTQGDIILVDMGPRLGHEQQGRRPVMVVSSTAFSRFTKGMAWVVPISSKMKEFPLHVALPATLQTKGEVLCQQLKALDLEARPFTHVERVPIDILHQVLGIVGLIVQE
jgi:mRNA interferase MazF